MSKNYHIKSIYSLENSFKMIKINITNSKMKKLSSQIEILKKIHSILTNQSKKLTLKELKDFYDEILKNPNTILSHGKKDKLHTKIKKFKKLETKE